MGGSDRAPEMRMTVRMRWAKVMRSVGRMEVSLGDGPM